MKPWHLLVCDLDNTLYDWVAYFVPSFYAMVDETVAITGCDREKLLDDFRTVHRKHHDAEYPFALLETNTIAALFPDKSRSEIATLLDPAFHAFNSNRKENLRLYPGVREALDELSKSKIPLVAHTESNLYAAVDRLRRLDLMKYFKKVFCRERSAVPHPNPTVAQSWLSGFPSEKIIELAHHERKPNPQVLLEICKNEYVAPSQVAYVGDSMARDMLMARDAGVYAVWAKYGASHTTEYYRKLVRVTHWSDEDVRREAELGARVKELRPDYVLDENFGEILHVLLPSAVKGRA